MGFEPMKELPLYTLSKRAPSTSRPPLLNIYYTFMIFNSTNISMKILITGGCGFVGSNISIYLKKHGFNVHSLDNLSRKGSRYNLKVLKENNIKNYKINIGNANAIRKLKKFHFIIDCCAEAAVEVSRKDVQKVVNTNLIGTINILEKAKRDKSKIIFLSSSRVFSIKALSNIVKNKVLKKKLNKDQLIDESFDTSSPRSIYGLTKLASEMFIEEYAYAFNIKYLINRCGVISGPLQFGKQDQGFISLWIWKHINKLSLKYIGYGGYGNQVRDILHISDLCELILIQIKKIKKINNRLFTVGGSKKNTISLNELTKKCIELTGNKLKIKKIKKTSDYDIPYYITNNSNIFKTYKWQPKKKLLDIVSDTYNWLNDNKKIIKKYF